MITEHNYEEYFLLYIDNELTTSEREMVEVFLNERPQYNAILNAFREVKLTEENGISFLYKETLYKDETNDIGINNYEEYFLLYTDNELTEQQREITERFVLQHPQLQEEFTLLQQAKLVPEQIEYKNKKQLYKKERRLIPLYIAGVSAAAAVFAILFFAGLLPSNHQQGSMVASTSIKESHTETKSLQNKGPQVDVVNHPRQQPVENITAGNLIKEKEEVRKASTSRKESHLVNNISTMPAQKQADKDIPLARMEDTHLAEPTLPDNRVATTQVSTLKPLEEVEMEQTNADDAMSLSDNNMAQPAVYKELNINDDNHTLYVSGLPINKNKVNGFLKSASRLLGGRSKQNEE